MSLRSDANLVRNATQVDPPENDEERIGGLFQRIADIVETVDTIADLRALDVSSLSHGDIVWVKSHSSAGLLRGLGGGPFRLNKNGLFEIDNVGGYTSGEKTITTTPTTVGFNLPPLERYSGQLPKVVFEGGAIGTFTQTDSLLGDRTRVYPTGTTSIGINLSASVTDNEKAFYPDDNGIKILLNSGDASFERVMEYHDNFATPEMFGAIPNYSSFDGAVNECSSAWQSALDSEYNVRANGGHYYIDTTLIIDSGKYIEMPDVGHLEYYFTDNRRTMFEDWAQASLYITTDITMVVFRARNIKWYGGVFDTRQAPSTYLQAAFRLDMSTSLAYSDIIKPTIIGDVDHLRAAADNGITGILLDTKNAVNDNSIDNTAGIGVFYNNVINVNAGNIHTVFHYNEEPLDNTVTYFANSLDFFVRSVRNKRLIYMEQALGLSTYNGMDQAGGNLQESQRDWPESTVKGYGSYYNIWSWDLTGNFVSDTNTYVPYLAIDAEGTDFRFGPLCLYQTDDKFVNKEVVQGNDFPELVNSEITLPTGSVRSPMQITGLENHLAQFHDRGTVTIEAYDGAGYDFDSNLSESTGQATLGDVTISNKNAMFQPQSSDTTVIEFEGTANSDTDFVEIVLDADGSNEALWLTRLSLHLDFKNQRPNRIQKFHINGGTAEKEENITNFVREGFGDVSYEFDNFAGSGTEKIIIRLIGFTGTGTFEIKEVSARSAGNIPYMPLIHTGGGQTVLGTFRAEEYQSRSLTYRSTQTLKKLNEHHYRVTKDLTSAEILDLNTTPITIINNSDSLTDGGIVVRYAYIKQTGGSTNYDTNTTLELFQNSFPDPTWASVDIGSFSKDAKIFDIQTGVDIGKFSGHNLAIRSASGNPATGDKTFQVIVEFEVFP